MDIVDFLNLELKVGDKFHYPEDMLGVSVDYRLSKIYTDDTGERIEFIPLKKTYTWKGKEYSFEKCILRRKDVINLLSKGLWQVIK